VPWNSCGAYMTGVLQVPTVEYLPFAFFNLINPLLSIAFGLTGFRVERTEPAEPHGQEAVGAPGDTGQPGPGLDPTPGGDRS
jgi:NhaC family Na+:H+ antiporter